MARQRLISDAIVPCVGDGQALGIPIPLQPTLPAILDAKIERAAAYAKAARSTATRRAYESDWAIF
ncbi:hypothetical protein ACTGU8_11715, partial [Streptococcus suis]